MHYHLFLDDERQPRDVTWMELPPYDWTIARNYNQFIGWFLRTGIPATVSFDHDLAPEHYKDYLEGRPEIQYDRFLEKTGYDCALWMVKYCRFKQQPLPVCFVHTLNTLGRKNILEVLNGGAR